MRRQAAFPGASSKQSKIAHTTLCRITSDSPLPSDVVSSVDAMCERWTAKLQGMRVVPDYLWWVIERQFSTIEGERELLRLNRA